MAVTLLDAAMGTELAARGIPTSALEWSARALRVAPEAVLAIHREHAAAGARVLTANTFRTRRRSAGEDWAELARLAVDLARRAAPPGVRVAGSVAPLEDCYSPWLSPPDPRPEHRELVQVLTGAGVDLLLCETFPHVGEALVAVEEAVAAGAETWVSFTAGPEGTLLSPAEVRAGAREAVARGAQAVLVNCIAASRILPWVEALAGLGVPFGAYANAGDPAEGLGWGGADPETAARRYAALAREWVAAGATLVGGCCGTTARHLAVLADLLAG